MSKIKIYRKRDWTTRFKPMVLYLDGQKFGYIHYGETKEIEVTPGPHKLRAKINLVGSRELEFTMFSKEVREFSVGINKGTISVILILVLGAVFLQQYIIKHHKPEPTIPFVIILLPLIIAVSLIFILKNSYLTIKEGVEN